MKLYPVYPRLLDQLLFLKNLYREDEYGFDAVSSNAGSISGEGKMITGVYKFCHRKVFERGFFHVMVYAANINFATYSSHFKFSIFSPKS